MECRDANHSSNEGCILLLQGGAIKEILCNPSSLFQIEPGDLLHEILTFEDRQRFLYILQDLREFGHITNRELTLISQDEPLSFHFSACLLEDHFIFMVIYRNTMTLLNLYESMIEKKSRHLPSLRLIFDHYMNRQTAKDGEEELYNQISELNNDLINLQRELTKKNKTLEKYSQEVDQVNQRITEVLNRLQEEFDKGKRLHQRFFPSSLPSIPGFTFSSFYQPASGIGGDFFNVISMGKDLLIYLADVSGHGLDGAMINIFLRGAINSFLLSQTDRDTISPQKIINYVFSQYVKEDFPGDSFLCLLLGILDLDKKVFTYSNAGFQIPPFLLQSGRVENPINRGMPISKVIFDVLKADGISPFYLEKMVRLPSPSTLLLTTDGLVEQKREALIFGEERVKRALLKGEGLHPKELKEIITTDLKTFTGSNEMQDDVTFLLIKRE